MRSRAVEPPAAIAALESVFGLLHAISSGKSRRTDYPDLHQPAARCAAAMGIAIAAETPDTQASQALSIIATNIDMAAEDAGPICQDTGMPTFDVHTPVGVNQIAIKKAIREAVAEATKRGKLRPNSVDSLTGKNSGDNLGEETPVIHFEQWEKDEIEVKLILKGGGCENKNIQYSLPWNSIIWARRAAIWKACASASCTPCGRRKGKAARRARWAYASAAIARMDTCSRNTSCSARWTTPIRFRNWRSSKPKSWRRPTGSASARWDSAASRR